MSTDPDPAPDPVPLAEDLAVLLAVCDVLTVKALETMGKWILRIDRPRACEAKTVGLPLHQAHTRWPVITDAIVDKALRGAWDVIPAMLDTHGCCDVTSRQVTAMLDSYVHDLAITGTRHTIGELRYRFYFALDLSIYPVTPPPVEAVHAAV